MPMIHLYLSLRNTFDAFDHAQIRQFLKINGKNPDADDPIKQFVDPKRKVKEAKSKEQSKKQKIL